MLRSAAFFIFTPAAARTRVVAGSRFRLLLLRLLRQPLHNRRKRIAIVQKLPPDVQATVMICLGLGGLRAQPLFWTSTGMAHVPVAYDIGYQWNGKRFEKYVQPVNDAQ